MKTVRLFLICLGINALHFSADAQTLSHFPRITPAGKGKVNTRVDNIGYWKRMAVLGYVEANRWKPIPLPVTNSSVIRAAGLFVQDSPDIPIVNSSATTQSENSIFLDPEDETTLLNSNNSSDWNGSYASNLYGCDRYWSFDAAATWGGSMYAVGQTNMGDPAAAIGRNGWWYVGKINNAYGQSVAYSINHGQTWTDVPVATVPGGWGDILDKNHLWIDNSENSLYEGNLYAGWSAYVSGSPNENQIEISRSTDHGLTWSVPVGISEHVNAGAHNQGVNIHTGPNGEVYAVWIIYDTWPSDETAIGFAKSLNGGVTWVPADRIQVNIKGIRASGTSKDMRVASFPCMTVDRSIGPNQGNLYVVWANIGVPGINTGNDIDIYISRSSNLGDTWSTPVRVNQDPVGLGKEHFLPWITCDPLNGNLCVIYYDDLNVDSTQLETWVSWSYDGGLTWDDFRVSDVAFTPVPIAGNAIDYFGDYIGIQAQNMKVYPVWTDNRTGNALAYVSPFELGPPPGQPYVSYYSYDLSPISGDVTQQMNYGDSLYLNLGLKNIGDQPADNLVATVSVTTPWVTLTDTTESYGSMAAGEIKVVPEGYSFKVSDTIPDGIRVKFHVSVNNSDTVWLSHFSIESHAPALWISKLEIDDETGGNNNGKLDPGETVLVKITTANRGDFPCLNTYGLLSCASPFITVTSDSSYLDTIVPLAPKTAVFSLTVDDEAPTGIGVFLDYTAVSGLYHADASFLETIGIIVEDWETNSFNKFPWKHYGNKWWTIASTGAWEGTYTAITPQLDDNTSAILQVEYTAGADDSVSFYRRVSSEPDYDFLRFYIDNVLMGSWSGDAPWSRAAFPVTAGTHTFKWIYVKDIYLSVGLDKAWVDYIEFPPPVLPDVNAGPDDTICAGMTCQLAGQVSGADSIRWITKGDGTFSNDTIPGPVYTPGPEDLLNGSVRLMLRGYVRYGSALNSMILTVGSIPSAAITVEPKDTLCSWQTGTLSVEAIPGASYLWSPGGFTTPVITIDTSVTGGTGTTPFTVTVASAEGCAGTDTVYITFRDCLGLDDDPPVFRYRVSPNPNHGEFTLELISPVPETVSCLLISPDDRILFSEPLSLVTGYNRKYFSYPNLPAGLYLLVIEKSSGKVREKVVVE